MINPMYFWYGLVGVVLMVFVVQFVGYLKAHSAKRRLHHHFVGMYKDRDIMFIPGDSIERRDDDEYDVSDEL